MGSNVFCLITCILDTVFDYEDVCHEFVFYFVVPLEQWFSTFMTLKKHGTLTANIISVAFSVTSFCTLLTLYPLQKAWINTAACSSVRSREAGMCGRGLTEREHLDCNDF